MIGRASQLDNLRLWLAAATPAQLADFLSAVRDELSTRLDFDSANYVTRALACLDVRRMSERLGPATTEPPAAA